LRHSDFIVNDPHIFNGTRVIGSVRREDRSFGGGGRSRVVINIGPGIDVVQRASGEKFSARPVADIVSREPIPSTVRRRTTDLKVQRPQLTAPATSVAHTPRQRAPGSTERPAQNGASQLGPTGRQQPQTFPQSRDTTPSQPRVNPTTPQTSPPRSSTPDRERPASPAQPSTTPVQPDRRGQTREVQPPVSAPEKTPPNRESPTPPTGREQPRTYSKPPVERPIEPPSKVQERSVERPPVPPGAEPREFKQEQPKKAPPERPETPPAASERNKARDRDQP
jgi:hypothetical protein